MTTDFRALCAELSDALRNAIRVVYHEDGTQHISTAMPILRRARAALADEPADGEVVELVAWLREQAGHELGSTFDADYFSEDPAARNLNRAADLLQRLSPPQPVPVSERLPGQEVEG